MHSWYHLTFDVGTESIFQDSGKRCVLPVSRKKPINPGNFSLQKYLIYILWKDMPNMVQIYIVCLAWNLPQKSDGNVTLVKYSAIP